MIASRMPKKRARRLIKWLLEPAVFGWYEVLPNGKVRKWDTSREK